MIASADAVGTDTTIWEGLRLRTPRTAASIAKPEASRRPIEILSCEKIISSFNSDISRVDLLRL